MSTRKIRRRVNSATEAGFPIGEFVEVEQIRFNKDGTIDVAIEDSEMPPALEHAMESAPTAENRKRRKNRRRR